MPLEQIVRNKNTAAEFLRVGVGKIAVAYCRAANTNLAAQLRWIDQLNFEQMAVLFGSHRSTISRRVAQVRERLLEETRRALQESLGVPSTEVSSLLRVAPAHLDPSLVGLLRES